MALHTQKGTGTVDAFQWLGGILNTSLVTLPIWAKQIALHSPGDGSLHVPAGAFGTLRANSTDWVIQNPGNGQVTVLTAVAFAAAYN